MKEQKIIMKPRMKGSSLSIETIVIMILAVIVLGAILLFFFSTVNPSVENIKAQQTITTVCGEIASYDCDYGDFLFGRGPDPDINRASAQLEKAGRLNHACKVLDTPRCSGTGDPGDECIRVCCQTFCRQTTTTT